LHALEVAGQEIRCEETDKYASDKQTIQQNVSAIEKKSIKLNYSSNKIKLVIIYTSKYTAYTDEMLKIMLSSTSTHNCHHPKGFLVKYFQPGDSLMRLIEPA